LQLSFYPAPTTGGAHPKTPADESNDLAPLGGPLIAAYVQATADGKTLLMESARALDPKFAGLLPRY
jgi:hypothetical protein